MRDDRKVEAEPELIPPVEAFDHDFDLSLDELEAASPTVLATEPSPDKPAADSFEAVLEQQAQAAQEQASNPALELPSDFDLSLAPESEPPVAQPDSFSLELDSGIVRHIGLYNIHKMLSLLYGASYGLKIESELGVGTRVELRMPYEMEESSC